MAVKDIKIQNVNPIADSKGAQKAGRKEKVAGQSFSDTLNSTVANLNNLNEQIPAGAARGATDASSAKIQKDIDDAKASFDRMMAEKQNLAQLYQRITNKDDT